MFRLFYNMRGGNPARSAGDSRSGKVVVVAHCLLNQNSVVWGLAHAPGAFRGLAELLAEKGYGIVQLPCPETSYAGLRRWWQSVEQYDNPGFRSHCKRLSEFMADYLEALREGGVEVVAVIGVKGSPSCGVHETFSAPWRGNPAEAPEGRRVNGRGVFMRIFLEELRRRGFSPRLYDFDTGNPGKSVEYLRGEL